MEKSGNQIGVSPIAKINPVTVVASVGDPAQSLDERASLLARQHAGPMSQQPASSLEQAAKITTSTADVSDAAKLINQLVKQAEANGVTHRYIAQSAITNRPKLPDVVSHQLKAAVSNSGLFYESHLSAFAEGQRSLANIKQEPQNQFNQSPQTLLPQQLHILEHQRLSWHGEVWPKQLMDWDIYLQDRKDDEQQQMQQGDDLEMSIASDITLQLPHLGKVTATISMQNGHIKVNLSATQKNTSQLLKDKGAGLVNAIESRGQVLEGLMIDTLDSQEVS